MQETGYTYPEAARELNTTVNTIRKAVTLGNLHPIKIPGERSKYISVEEVNQSRGKSLLAMRRHFEPTVAPAPAVSHQPTQNTQNSGATISDERLALVIQFIQALFAGLTSEAGKVSTHLITAALGSTRFAETMKVIEDFANLAEGKQGATPQDIGEFIQRIDTATSNDLGVNSEAPVDMKVRAATLLAQEAQRQNVLLNAS